jgi:hypothetical protein
LTPEGRERARRVRRRVAIGAAGVAAAWLVFAAWVERCCIYEPPAIPPPPPGAAVLRDAGGILRFGSSWLHEDTGIQELCLAGDPVQRAYAMASLCEPGLDAEEDQLMADLDRLLPSPVKRYFLRKGLLLAFRSYPGFLEEDDRRAVAAMARVAGTRPSRPADAHLPAYHRMLFYQSLYDSGQAMAEAGIVDAGMGCTSFAASGPATRSGGLIVGRNCDFEAGAVFDERKTVQFVSPSRGKRYVSVSWAGMLGVVTGVNADGLFLALHAARTERTRRPRPGTPVPLLLRDALLEDATIEQVAERLRRAPEHAAAIVVVGEGRTGRSAVIETDFKKAVVLPATAGVTVASNHFRDSSWDGDAVVGAARRRGSSARRLARMQERVESARGRIDGAEAGSILRDRFGAGGSDIGLGNRSAIAALIAAHAVVYDASAGRLLVSRAPRGLGEFVAYDLADFFAGGTPAGPGDLRAPGPSAVAAAPDPEAAARVERARTLLRSSEAARTSGGIEEALHSAGRAALDLHRSPEALLALAEALVASGEPSAAAAAAQEALGRSPVPGPEEDRLREIAATPAR